MWFARLMCCMSGSSSTALCARNAHITLYDVTTWRWVNLVNPTRCPITVLDCQEVVSQARLSLGRRESGQIPIWLLYCILSSRAPNEVGVNINWDAFCKSRSSVSLNSLPKKATARLHSSLTQLTRQEILGVLETRR